MKRVKSRAKVFAIFIIGAIMTLSVITPPATASASIAAFDCSAWVNSPTQANARCNLGLGGVRAWADVVRFQVYQLLESTVLSNRSVVFPALYATAVHTSLTTAIRYSDGGYLAFFRG
jgi:hypothetical protein